jgi:hypothetical protein
VGLEEFGEMTAETWREKHDRVAGSVVKLEVGEFEKGWEASRKERDDWRVADGR